jgi:hypothetical protein
VNAGGTYIKKDAIMLCELYASCLPTRTKAPTYRRPSMLIKYGHNGPTKAVKGPRQAIPVMTLSHNMATSR